VDVHNAFRQPGSFRTQTTGAEETSQIHCRSAQTASGEDESFLGGQEKGCGQTPVKASEQAEENGQYGIAAFRTKSDFWLGLLAQIQE
jgi:hypothetical protein